MNFFCGFNANAIMKAVAQPKLPITVELVLLVDTPKYVIIQGGKIGKVPNLEPTRFYMTADMVDDALKFFTDLKAEFAALTEADAKGIDLGIESQVAEDFKFDAKKQ